MKFYVSFGQKYNLKNSFMVFDDMSEDQVRDYMQRVYGNRYAFIYQEEDAMEQIPKYDLTLVKPGVDLYERY